jgi:hypothetical protein
LPFAPKHPCSKCGRATDKRFCERCAPQVERARERNEPWRAWYRTPRWKALRWEVLTEAMFKCQCEECQGQKTWPGAPNYFGGRKGWSPMRKGVTTGQQLEKSTSDEASKRRRFYLMSVEEAQMWVNLMGKREAERYYPGILKLLRTAGEVNARR